MPRSGNSSRERGHHRRRRRGEPPPSSSSYSLDEEMPVEVVCTAHAVASSKNSIELGLVLSCFVFGLYLHGFYASMMVLPAVATGRSLGGGNLNLAKLLPNKMTDPLLLDIKTPEEYHNLQQQQIGDSKEDEFPMMVPYATWPVMKLQDIPSQFETILHPGDTTTQMSVPKFWSPPLQNPNVVFTRDQAMKVGTCIEVDPITGSHVRGDACPPHQRTIFLAIASYRDYQCRYTVESVFNRAEYPERIRVAIVDQIVEGDDPRCDEPIEPCDTNPSQALCKHQNQVDVYEMAAHLSVGPVFARHLGHRMYRGEYYTTQSDAHVSYTHHWDSDIIDQMETTHNEMAVLTTYLTDVQGSIDPNNFQSLRHTRPIMCNTVYEAGGQGEGMHLRHGTQPERTPSIHGSPQLQPWWAAGYSFSRGHFVVNVPYDQYQPMVFQGEEMSIGIRGFTIGYDYYAPERSVCFHHYNIGKNAAARNRVKHFWENGDLYAGTGSKSMNRLLGIVHMNPEIDPSWWDHTEEERYGIGDVRTPEQFYGIFGIDVVNKHTEGELCLFVDTIGRMHKQFTPFLTSNGMSIDYSNIHFQWVAPKNEVAVKESSVDNKRGGEPSSNLFSRS